MADQEILSISIDPGDSAAKALELKKQLEALAKESEDLAKSFKAGAVGLDEHIGRQDALAKKVAATTAAYEKQVATIQKAATQTASINTSMGGAVPSSAPGGNKGINTALLQGGRMAQDVQYGFSAITNNLIEIAPALGVAALLIDGITKNSDAIADKFKGWSEALKDSNREMSDLATQGEAFFRSFNFGAAKSWWGSLASGLMDKGKLDDLLGRSATNPFGIAGAIADTKWINPEGDAQKAKEAREAKEGRDALSGYLGKDAEDRIKSLKDTLKSVGGQSFEDALTKGDGKEARDAIFRSLNKALATGDEGAFGAIRARLMKNDPLLASQLDRNMPEFQEETKRQQKKLDDLKRNEEEAAKQREKQAKDDLKAANDRARDTNEQLDREEREAKQKMQGKARDTLDEMDGLKGNASLTYARYLANGASPDSASRDIAESIQRELEARGIDSDTAREQAGDYARGVRRDVGNRIVAAGMSAEREILNKPAVFGLADANRLAQEAGPKIQEEQRDLLKLTVEHLAGIRSSGFPAVVGP